MTPWLLLTHISVSLFKVHDIQLRGDNRGTGLLLLCRLALLRDKALGPLEDNRQHCASHVALHQTDGHVVGGQVC